MEHLGWFDGACPGNPGPMGLGCLIVREKDAEIVCASSKLLGQGTNNESEYNALLLLLEKAAEHNIQNLHVHGDSKLVIMQMTSEWGVSSSSLRPLYKRAKRLSKKFESIKFTHVKREFNKEADILANEAYIMMPETEPIDEFPNVQYNMFVLQEECAEVIKVASKINRFGADSCSPGTTKTNVDTLASELGDLQAMIDIIVSNNIGITKERIANQVQRKRRKLKKFYDNGTL